MNAKQEKLLKSKAELIFSRIEKTEFSIITIITIFQLLIALYRLYKACNKTETETVEMFKKPGLLQKRMIKKVVQRSIPNDFDANQVYKGIMDMHKEITKTEAKLLYSNEE